MVESRLLSSGTSESQGCKLVRIILVLGLPGSHCGRGDYVPVRTRPRPRRREHLDVGVQESRRDPPRLPHPPLAIAGLPVVHAPTGPFNLLPPTTGVRAVAAILSRRSWWWWRQVGNVRQLRDGRQPGVVVRERDGHRGPVEGRPDEGYLGEWVKLVGRRLVVVVTRGRHVGRLSHWSPARRCRCRLCWCFDFAWWKLVLRRYLVQRGAP